MNQKSRQKATSCVEREFLKLPHNRNYGIDCKNNIDNCILKSLDDGLTEISYIKKFTTIFIDNKFKRFFFANTIKIRNNSNISI